MFRAHFFNAVDDRSSIIVAIGDSHSVHRHQTSLLLERNAYSDQKLLSMGCGSTKLKLSGRTGATSLFGDITYHKRHRLRA
jgi:hypothetical protein